jgi:hypothetical protein
MNTSLHTLMDVIDAAGLEHSEFIEDAFVLCALALSTLPLEERERYLGKIECGDLRGAVQLFREAHRSPYPQVAGHGYGRAH